MEDISTNYSRKRRSEIYLNTSVDLTFPPLTRAHEERALITRTIHRNLTKYCTYHTLFHRRAYCSSDNGLIILLCE